MVGKNEAGKTAILKALYRLNPIIETDGEFNAIDDYPRQSMISYETDVRCGRREHVQVVQATFILDLDDIEIIKDTFGSKCFKKCFKDEKPSITLYKGYSNEYTFDDLNIDIEESLKYLVENAGLSKSLEKKLCNQGNVEDIKEILANVGQENTKAVDGLLSIVQYISDHGISDYVYYHFLHDRVPKFLYFDEYYQMRGQDNLDALKGRVGGVTILKTPIILF